jgi:hypothetical protein
VREVEGEDDDEETVLAEGEVEETRANKPNL